jgi:hypothetical protein
MVGSPDRANNTWKLWEVAEQNTSTIVWPKRTEAFITTEGPRVAEMPF